MTNKEKWESLDKNQRWSYIKVSKGHIKELNDRVEYLRNEKDLDNLDLGYDEEISNIMIDNLGFCEKELEKFSKNSIKGREIWEERKKKKSIE